MKEIGGDFEWDSSWFASVRTEPFEWPEWDPPRAVWTAAGRDALAVAISCLPPGTVLLPAFLCPAVFQPFSEAGRSVRYYELDEQLRPDPVHLRSLLEEPVAALVAIDFFGWTSEPSFRQLLRDRKVTIIQDATHSIFNEPQSALLYGDIVVASLRKHGPIPDGGLCYLRSNSLRPTVAPAPPVYVGSVLERLLGSGVKAEFVSGRYVDRQRMLAQLKRIEHELDHPRNPVQMTELSRELLLRFGVGAMRDRRRRNYLALQGAVADHQEIRPLFPELPIGTCPLGFVIVAQERDQLRNQLIQEGVFAPIHWTLPPEAREASSMAGWLSDHVLTIPCDQRYDVVDLLRVGSILRNFS